MIDDENIIQAMQRLHSPTRGSNEEINEFNARVSASQRLRREIEDSQRAEWRKLHQRQELDTEVSKLLQEQEQHEDEREQPEAVKHDSRKERSRRDTRPGGDMRRREHYREWLATQVILDSMREGDITETGFSNIPARDKRAGYPGYPRSENSDHWDGNATPGPSRPRRHKNQEDIRETRDRTSDRESHSPKERVRKSNHMGNDPSDPSDDTSSSDSTYKPDHTEPTDSEATTSSPTVEDGSDQCNRSHRRDSCHTSRATDRHRNKRHRTVRRGHGNTPDSSDSDGDDRLRRSSCQNRRSQSCTDPRSTRYGTRSTGTRYGY